MVIETQINNWVTNLASGQFLGAWGLTEHNTGSDAGGMSTTAVKVGNEWVLNGTKNFITHGISADVYVIILKEQVTKETREACQLYY